MAFSVGIVGLPNVGKSTLFAALTRKKVDIANYPFCTIEPNVGIVKVPDERLEKLSTLFNSEKTVPTIIEFVDIAGLVRGANKGEGLGNKFLSHIREVKAMVQVVRCFESSEIAHVEKDVDPVRDIEIINTEMILKDLDMVQKRLFKAEKEAKTKEKKPAAERELLEGLQTALGKGESALQYAEQHPANKEATLELQLLTAKPVLYLLNCDSAKAPPKVAEKIKDMGALSVVMNVQEEFEYAGLSIKEVKELGGKESRLHLLIEMAYKALDLITFFTTGPDETRAWTIKKGTMAPQAAGVIHSDFEDKFIRAAVIHYSKLMEAGDLVQAMNNGEIRTEGKDYIVRDGDVMEIRHG